MSTSTRPQEQDPTPSWIPVDACTLPTVEQPVREAEFDSVFEECLTSVQASGRRARLLFSGGEAVRARLTRLTERETSCCSFFAFDLGHASPAGEVVQLDIIVPAGREDVLGALVARARQLVA